VTGSSIRIVPIERLELSFTPKPWAFAAQRRADIDAHFAALRREKPALWNGRIVMLHDQTIADGIFRGAFLETDYASFAAWIDWGRPPAGVYDCFGAAAILAADGAFLLGVMGAQTLNAGQIYFPCGTPDPSDVVDGKVDFDASVRRELAEETGLDANEFVPDPGWTMVVDGALIAQIKVFHARQSADELRGRALSWLSRQAQPELADVRIARGPADVDPAMRPFVRAFLADCWERPEKNGTPGASSRQHR
jgi:8-oxo-dGTP pyrophosphatase MutT (NUDIX family)